MKTAKEILQDLIEIIHFTENVSAKIRGVLDEPEVYRVVKEEFARSGKYTISILLLTDEGSKLRIAETSLATEKRKAGEKVSGVRLKEYRIDLNKSSIYRRVVKEEKTIVTSVSETIGELFTPPVAHLISKTLGYQKKKKSILTPLYTQGKIIGALAMSSTDLYKYLIPSVKNLTQHISNALELAHRRSEREKEVREALRKSENLSSSIIEQSPFSTWIADANGTKIRQNAACRKLFGIDYDQQTVGKYNMFSDPVIKEQGLTQELRKVFDEGKTVRLTVDYDFSRVKNVNVPHATHKILKVTIFPIKDVNGKVINAVVQHEDITERKKAEEGKEKLQAQLIHSAKMAALGTLASGIAHEFSNLLQIVIGHVAFAQRTKKPEDMEDALNIVLDTSGKATEIIRYLSTFSGQEVSEREPCDITELVESVLLLVDKQLKKHNIRVVRKYERIPAIRVNKAEMQQVFLGIVINARDAMLPKGGKLGICVKQVKGNIEVGFSDTGKGIKKENLNKVFEPFYTTKGAFGGSTVPGMGLGLSVSYGIMQRHRGTIEVSSQAGQGTIFTVKLPVKEIGSEERIIEEQEKKESENTQHMNILVMDNEEEICKILINWLSTKGHRAKSALTGREAIELVKNEHFNIAFLDIIMPGIPGNIVLEEIKRISPKTKVIMITGKLMSHYLLNALREKGASGCIQKPFGIEEINRALA